MPEAPECAVQGDFLANFIGYQVTFVEYSSEWLATVNSTIKIPLNCKFTNVQVTGKHIFLFFDSSPSNENDSSDEYESASDGEGSDNSRDYIVECKLGMTGHWVSGYDHEKTQISIHLQNDSSVEQIFFNCDPTDKTLKWSIVDEAYIASLPPCIIADSHEITPAFIKNLVTKHKKMSICSFLLNQDYMSGIGNYLKSEILFYCKIDPHTTLGMLTNEQIGLLAKNIVDIAARSYKAGGYSMKDYYMPDGQPGKYFPRVYGKRRYFAPDGTEYPIKEETICGRKTYYVEW